MTEPRLPTKEDILQLPRWARVAFAARCARRALPVFRERWANAPEKHLEAVDNAVRVAEHAAAAAAAAVSQAAANADDAAYAAAYADGDAAAANADVAAAAATYAAIAAYAADADADAAAAAAARAARAGIPTERITSDFQTILELAHKQKWDDTTPVPPSVFGPLEPLSKGHQLEVEFEVPADWTEEQIGAYVARLADHLDDVHRAAGGHGLRVHDLDILREAGVPAEVRS